jgi:cobalt/nickel transport system ATP-binding protein
MSQTALDKVPPNIALDVSELHFSYPDKPDVLRAVGLRVEEGERLAVIGPNGAGKTTLFLLICGVLKAGRGRIELFGQPMTYGDFHPQVGMVFQDPDDQLFSPSVWDDIAFGPLNLGLTGEEVQARVMEAMKTTGVHTLGERAPHHLSGGEKRMVSIAGVLAMRPRLVIYDEPSANLDIRSRRRLIQFLRRENGTALLASHDLELVLEVCDRVILMDEGRIVAQGEPREVMQDQALMEQHGLERPHSLLPHVYPHHG